MKEITKAELLTHFDPSVWDDIKAMEERVGVTHLVEFVNVTLDSSKLGENSVVAVGPGCTCKNLAAAKKTWLRDLPSERQYPQYYVVL